jgi:dTDP-4-dehydrorhamnose 3,5-epimerase
MGGLGSATVQLTETSLAGVWIGTPKLFSDDRGQFLEAFKADILLAASGRDLTVAQANTSISKRGSLRGIHFSDVPPGQAKYVTCTRGAVLDIAIDIRTGSPTFGEHVAVQLDDVDRRAVFLEEGIGHAFMALTDNATVTYLCSTPYSPGREHAVHPLDPALALPWPTDIEPVLSEKDAVAPTLAQAAEAGLLPSYPACQDFLATLRPTKGRVDSGQ